jgi:hypothetical protein
LPEVGHTFGLDDQDENFNNENFGTCMHYARDPDGTLNSAVEQPASEWT